MNLIETCAKVPLLAWPGVALDSEVVLAVAGLVAFQQVILSLLRVNAIHFTSTVIAMLKPRLHGYYTHKLCILTKPIQFFRV